jgi:uncharacterized protein (DUF1778 family)
MTYNVRVPSKKEERIELRAKAEDVKAWRQAAEREDMTLSDWIRRQLRAAVEASPAPAKKSSRRTAPAT